MSAEAGGITTTWALKYAFEGGGEGLTSTMEDYLKFCVMLLRNGYGG